MVRGVFEIWKGGLGIWAGSLGGVIAGAWVVHRSGNSVFAFMDAVAPGLLLAQAIGRWGNYFNQELFGKPTDLPWGLEIAVQNRPEAYIGASTFHPLFLYESIWNLLGMAVLLLVDRRFRIRPPGLFALYVAGTRRSASTRRRSGSTPRTVLRPAAELLRGRRALRLSIVAFVWSQRRARSETVSTAPCPEGPAMAVPKGASAAGTSIAVA